MATKIECDRCRFATEDKRKIGCVEFTKCSTLSCDTKYDLCPSCVDDVEHMVADECLDCKSRGGFVSP